MIWTELDPQFLSLAVTRMVHSMMHLGMPSDSPMRNTYMRCELVKLYSLISIMSSDRYGISSRCIGL
jgi:hypothetical protein